MLGPNKKCVFLVHNVMEWWKKWQNERDIHKTCWKENTWNWNIRFVDCIDRPSIFQFWLLVGISFLLFCVSQKKKTNANCFVLVRFECDTERKKSKIEFTLYISIKTNTKQWQNRRRDCNLDVGEFCGKEPAMLWTSMGNGHFFDAKTWILCNSRMTIVYIVQANLMSLLCILYFCRANTSNDYNRFYEQFDYLIKGPKQQQ